MSFWPRLGISVAIVAAFSILMTEVFQGMDFYQLYRWAICAGLLAMGAFLLVIGRFVNNKIRETQRAAGDEHPAGPFLLVNLEYWGLLLSIFGVLVIFIVPYKRVEARASVPRTNAPVIKPVTNQPPLVLPNYKLQGVVLNQGRASALINGRTYFVSNRIGDSVLLSISPTNVVLESYGQKHVITLDD